MPGHLPRKIWVLLFWPPVTDLTAHSFGSLEISHVTSALHISKTVPHCIMHRTSLHNDATTT